MKISNKARSVWKWRSIIGFTVLSAMLFGEQFLRLAPTCVTKSWLGVSCPGCGMTTAAVHLAAFEFEAAFAAHALVFPVALSVLLFLVLPLDKIIRLQTVVSSYRKHFVVAIFSVFSLYWILRSNVF